MRVSGSHRSRSRASWICRTRCASGDVERRDGAGPDDAVGLEGVTALEALDGVDERAGVEGRAVVGRLGRRGVRGQVAEGAQPRGEGGRPRPGLPRLDLLLLGGESRHRLRLAGRGERAVVGERLHEAAVDGELRLGGGDGGGEAARVARGAERRGEVEPLGADVVVESDEARVDAAPVGRLEEAHRDDAEGDVEEGAVGGSGGRAGPDRLPLLREGAAS